MSDQELALKRAKAQDRSQPPRPLSPLRGAAVAACVRRVYPQCFSPERTILAVAHGRNRDAWAESSRETRIHDESLALRASILNAITASGSIAERIHCISTLHELPGSIRCGTALVAAGKSLPDGTASLELIEHLRSNGFTVIGYEDGANTWSLARRCRFLLTGCSFLLDSSAAFRSDLFHRLNVLSIHIPPVRERRADTPPLGAHFARKHQALNAAASRSIAPELIEALGPSSASWRAFDRRAMTAAAGRVPSPAIRAELTRHT